MPPPKGPGRKMKPGPKIQQSAQIPIPDELVEGAIKEILDGSDLEQFEQLPAKIKQEIIGNFKKSLFAVSAKRLGPAVLSTDPEDLAGVFVSASLNPQDFLKKGYIPSTVLGWLKGITQLSDFEIALEARLVRNRLRGVQINGLYAPPPIVGDSTYSYYEFDPEQGRVVSAKNYSVEAGGVLNRTLPRGDTVPLAVYKEFADSVSGFIPTSQVFGLRDYITPSNKALKVFDIELGSVGHSTGMGFDPKTGTRHYETNVLSNNLTSFLTKGTPVPQIAQEFYGVPAHLLEDLKRRKIISQKDVGSATLYDLVRRNRRAVSNAHSLTAFLEQLQSSPTGVSLLCDSLLVGDTWRQLGFSSPQAVQQLRVLASSKNLNEAEALIFNTLLEKTSYDTSRYLGSKVIPGLRSVSRADLLKFRTLVSNLKTESSEVLNNLVNFRGDLLDRHFDEILDYTLSQIPDDLKDEVSTRLRSVKEHYTYVRTRANQIMLAEFVSAIEQKNVWKLYMFYSKYNEQVNRVLGDLVPFYNQFLNIPLGNYRVGDLFKGAEAVREFASNRIGLSSATGYTEDEAPILTKLLPGSLVLNHKHFFAGDFIAQDAQKVSLNVFGSAESFTGKINLFKGKTYVNLRQNYENFKSGGIKFVNLKYGSLNLYAKDFEGAPYILKVFGRLAKDAGVSDLNYFHELFASFYELHKQGDFQSLDTVLEALFGQTLNANELNTFKGYFYDILETFKKYETQGLDPYDMFSTLVTHVQGNFVRGEKIVKYAGLLNATAEKLNYAQTWLFKAVEHRVLEHTLFKIPLLGRKLFRPLWALYKPGVGSYASAQNFVAWFSSSFPRLSGAFSKLVGGATRIFSSLGVTMASISTLGLAYLAYAIQSYTTALLKGLWSFLRGKGLSEFYKGLSDATRQVFVTIPKFFGKFIGYTVIFLVISLFLIFYYVNYLIFDQSSRPIEANSFSESYGDTGVFLPISSINDFSTCFKITGSVPPVAPLASLMSLPVSSASITDCPGKLRTPTYAHKGVDIAAPLGTKVSNPFNSNAEVFYSGFSSSGYGNLIILKVLAGGNPYYLYFAHLSSRSVSTGDTVSANQVIGEVGSTGNSTGPHLHFEVRGNEPKITHIMNPCSIINCSAYSQGNKCKSDEWGNQLCTY